MPADYGIAFNQNKQHHKREKIYESNRAKVRSHKSLFRDILYQNIDEKTRLVKIAENSEHRKPYKKGVQGSFFIFVL